MCVCVSVSISLEPLDRSSQNFVCRSPVTMAWSACGSIAIRYVLLVFWMTSHLAVMGRMAMCGRLNLSPTTTGDVVNTGVESDVYECLVIIMPHGSRTYTQYNTID